MVISYGIAGFGIALQVSNSFRTLDLIVLTLHQNAGANGFVGSLKKNTGTKLCFLHGSYGMHLWHFLLMLRADFIQDLELSPHL